MADVAVSVLAKLRNKAKASGIARVFIRHYGNPDFS